MAFDYKTNKVAILLMDQTTQETLSFQYIPNDFREVFQVKYDKKEAQGKRIQAMAYKQGEPRIVTFTLFVSEWGKYAVENQRRFRMSPEETVKWLEERMYTKGEGRTIRPPVVFDFVGWTTFACVLTRLVVGRDFLRPDVSGKKANELFRGTLKLTLVEKVDPPSVE